MDELPSATLRNLGDRSYEKRKQAALEVETKVRERIAAGDNDSIYKIIRMLKKEFIESTQPNQRKGGLIGLAATAIGLVQDAQMFLEKLLPPVLQLLKDHESRVRYYACEALYNITKVVRGNVLVFFNEIFDGLCTLYADVDVDVKNGAQLLDRLIKDVVTESDSFDLEKFIPLLRERVLIKDPFIRQLVVGWITVLDSVPDVNMLEYLPEYLGGLFNMLSDSQKDIRQQADSALGEFLREITEVVIVEFGPMVSILVDQCNNTDMPPISRLTALTWLHEFIRLARTKLIPFYPDVLGALLQATSDSEDEIRQKAEKANNILLELVQATEEQFDVDSLFVELTCLLGNKWEPTRLASLRWICMLLTKLPDTIFHLHFLDYLFPPLLKTLSDNSEQVVRLDLEVLARIAVNDEKFDMVLNNLVRLFSADRKLLETRGSLIIRQLCVLLNGERIYHAFARILQAEEDLDFASLIVQTLSLIVLTSAELFELRSLLKESLVTNEGRDLFISLYKSWCHNPVAILSLCLMAQCYELACALVFHFADIEVNVPFMMQIDKLVQLIESPIFIHLRLQLLEPNRHPFLLKSLYGLMMLLPQSSAFNYLKIRLESVSTIGMLQCIPESSFAVSRKFEVNVKETDKFDFKNLLETFRETQKKHAAHRKSVLRQNSLLNTSVELKTAKDPVAVSVQK